MCPSAYLDLPRYYSDVTHNIGAISVNTVDRIKTKYSIRQYSKSAHALKDRKTKYC